jgi:hypothetical protein
MWRRVHPMSLYANGLRAQHHISGKTTFRTLCAPAHKVRESRPPGSVRGVLSNGHSYRDSPREWSQRSELWHSRKKPGSHAIELSRHAIENQKMKTRCFDHIDLRVKGMEVARKLVRKISAGAWIRSRKSGRRFSYVLCWGCRSADGIFQYR